MPNTLSRTTAGNFIPTTQNFDVQALYESDVSSNKFKELIVRLAVFVNQMSININSKASGHHSTKEFATGATIYPNPNNSSATGIASTLRPILSTTVNFGTLPSTTSPVGKAHGIGFGPNYSLFRIYGGCTNAAGTSGLTLPYASPVLNENIAVYIDATNVYVKTGIDRSTYTKCDLVIEYFKN